MSHQNDVTITIAGHPVKVPPGLLNGARLRTAGQVPDGKQIYFEVKNEVDVPVGPTDLILVDGGEEFSVGGSPLPDNPDRIEPIGIRINRKEFAVNQAKLTSKQILDMFGASADGSLITVDVDHLPDEPLAETARLVLTKKLSFLVTPRGNVGFHGLQDQLAELRELYPALTVQNLGTASMVIIPAFPLPAGWSETAVDLMIQVPREYPGAALDMFWVPPGLRLMDGRMPQAGNELEAHGGRQWQRFSWHYARAWQPGVDTLVSHIQFCNARLQQLS